MYIQVTDRLISKLISTVKCHTGSSGNVNLQFHFEIGSRKIALSADYGATPFFPKMLKPDSIVLLHCNSHWHLSA